MLHRFPFGVFKRGMTSNFACVDEKSHVRDVILQALILNVCFELVSPHYHRRNLPYFCCSRNCHHCSTHSCLIVDLNSFLDNKITVCNMHRSKLTRCIGNIVCQFRFDALIQIIACNIT